MLNENEPLLQLAIKLISTSLNIQRKKKKRC